MKIIFDYQIFSLQKYGGISRYIFELVKNITEINTVTKASIACPIYVNQYLNDKHFKVDVTGWHMPQLRRTTRILLAINRVLSFCIFKFKAPDIVHETYYSESTVAPRKSKIILTVHDMIHELYADKFPPKDSTSANKKTAVERADHIICVSENTRKDLIRLFNIEPSKTSVIHLGFSLTSSKLKTTFSNRKPYLFYTGVRSTYKNFDALLDAYATSPTLVDKFDLIAFGGGNFNSIERMNIERHGLDCNQVRHVSGNDELLEAVYRNAALFVYPSLYEGFGIPPLEAMSFDCPVACSNTSSMPEVVGDAAYLFDPRSPRTIQDALEVITNNVDMQNDLRRKGKLRIQSFSWKKCAVETLQVYNKVLK